MPFEIHMPMLSPTMQEGAIARWCKKEGDVVESGDVLCEIETDKATMEVEAVEEGTLAKRLFADGTQGIAVGATIGLILASGEDASALQVWQDQQKLGKASPETKPRETTPPERESVQTASAGTASGETTSADTTSAGVASHAEARDETEQVSSARVDSSASPTRPAESATAFPPPTTATSRQTAPEQTPRRIPVSPLARRLARDYDIPLEVLRSGVSGRRIVKADVEDFQQAAAREFAVRRATSGSVQTLPGARQLADFLGRTYELEPLSSMRRSIAQRMQAVKQEAPHFYLQISCPLDALLDVRAQLNQGDKPKLSINDFLIRAVAETMVAVPDVNRSFDAACGILCYQDVDVSVAVSGKQGLLTPVVRRADTKSIYQISTEMRDLIHRVDNGKLRPQEYQGGGFTISNLGMFGIRSFSAILNPPQSCILAVGAAEKRAVVRPNGEIAVETHIDCTLSVDHRAIDGAQAARFLQKFQEIIARPALLLV